MPVGTAPPAQHIDTRWASLRDSRGATSARRRPGRLLVVALFVALFVALVVALAPGRRHLVRARVGDRLTQVLVRVRLQLQERGAPRDLLAEEAHLLVEVGVG